MNRATRVLFAATLVVLVAGLSETAQGAIAFDNSAGVPGVGLQNWAGNLGLDFIVNSPVTVTQLGVFDNGDPSQLDGVAGAGVTVGIFDVTSGLLVAPGLVINPSTPGTQVNGDYMVDVAPFNLAPGLYSIVTLDDRNYNTGFGGGVEATLNDGGGLLNFSANPTLTARWDGSGTFGFPTSNVANPQGADSGQAVPVPRFDAGTFAFQATVPEASPALIWTLLGGMGCCATWLRGKRRG
ncbi:MAG TPA: hypothetical protein VGN12_22685 [Pirellulales bacterium]|jgi:hypothetical protein